MWWGYSWHVTFPHPPVHITKAIDTILALHDENLHSHMTLLGASPGLLGWSMITSLFTELLSKEDWLKLMDYLFSHISNSGLVILTVVAILRHIRTSLLSAGNTYPTCEIIVISFACLFLCRRRFSHQQLLSTSTRCSNRRDYSNGGFHVHHDSSQTSGCLHREQFAVEF